MSPSFFFLSKTPIGKVFFPSPFNVPLQVEILVGLNVFHAAHTAVCLVLRMNRERCD